MNKPKRPRYKPDEVKTITEAYQHIFGSISAELRAYWDLDRKRDWGCLTTDFNTATFEQYQEASNLVEDIRIQNLEERGLALKEVTRKTGVGLSLGVCPWTDHGLFQTYEQNKRKGQLTIILGHDWYPIVADKEHPADAPLYCDQGLHTCKKYIGVGAVPPAIVNRSELLLFLNFNPDYRKPNTSVAGRFKPDTYRCCAKGFNALVEAVSRNFEVKLISWGAPVWESLREQVNGTDRSLSVMQNAKEKSGCLLDLCCGRQSVRYLPLAHPCYASNFKKSYHAEHVRKGFKAMGLAG